MMKYSEIGSFDFFRSD